MTVHAGKIGFLCQLVKNYTMTAEFVEKNHGRNWRSKKNRTGKSYTSMPPSLHLQRSESAELLTDAQLDEH